MGSRLKLYWAAYLVYLGCVDTETRLLWQMMNEASIWNSLLMGKGIIANRGQSISGEDGRMSRSEVTPVFFAELMVTCSIPLANICSSVTLLIAGWKVRWQVPSLSPESILERGYQGRQPRILEVAWVSAVVFIFTSTWRYLSCWQGYGNEYGSQGCLFLRSLVSKDTYRAGAEPWVWISCTIY